MTKGFLALECEYDKPSVSATSWRECDSVVLGDSSLQSGELGESATRAPLAGDSTQPSYTQKCTVKRILIICGISLLLKCLVITFDPTPSGIVNGYGPCGCALRLMQPNRHSSDSPTQLERLAGTAQNSPTEITGCNMSRCVLVGPFAKKSTWLHAIRIFYTFL